MKKIKVKIKVVTGLSILSGVETFEIGGVDRTIIKTVYKIQEGNKERELLLPFIPGSSLKGKISNLLEREYFGNLLKLMKIWIVAKDFKKSENPNETKAELIKALKKFNNAVIIDEQAQYLLDNLNKEKEKIDLFFSELEIHKASIEDENNSLIIKMLEEYYNNGKIFEEVKKEFNDENRKRLSRFLKLFRSIGGVVLIFEDLYPTKETIEYWNKIRDVTYDLGTEIKYENIIDRITGQARNPRPTERIVSGSEFEGYIIYLSTTDNEQEINEDLELIKKGLELLENRSYLGSSGSRGYGRVKISICIEN